LVDRRDFHQGHVDWTVYSFLETYIVTGQWQASSRLEMVREVGKNRSISIRDDGDDGEEELEGKVCHHMTCITSSCEWQIGTLKNGREKL